MSDRLKSFLKRWLINTLAVLAATHVLDGISYDGWQALLIATLLLGIFNTVLRPIKIIFWFVTLGLVTWMINAGLLMLVGALVSGFDVISFKYALGGALIISVISIVLTHLTGSSSAKIEIRRGSRRSRPRNRDRDGGGDGGGPVIDV